MAVVNQDPEQLDLRLTRGDAFSEAVTLAVGGVPLNLTGATYLARWSGPGACPIVIATVNAAAGQASVTYPDIAPLGHFRWSLAITLTGARRTYFKGKLIASGDAGD